MNRIKELIDKKGITQKQLAAEIGVTEVTISRYIHENRMPRQAIVHAMARYFGVTKEYLLGHE